MRLFWEIPALATAALVAACSTITSGSASLCPPPKRYSADQEARAAHELLALPEGSVLAEMLIDYGRERAALGACRGERSRGE